MDKFDESRAEFRGFNRFYSDNIEEGLLALDMERRAAVKSFWKWTGIGVILGGAALGLSLYYGYTPFGFFVGFVGLGIGIYKASTFISSVGLKTKTHLVGKICNYVGLTFTPKDFSHLDLEKFRTLKMLPKANRESFEDQMTGLAHGANFVLHEAHLEQRRRQNNKTTYVTVFRGIIMALDFPVKFDGTTLILRDTFFKRKSKAGLNRVGLADPKFEKAFEAFGSDQVEARYLLTPTFMQRLMDLEEVFNGRKLRAAFTDGSLIIAIETGNQFEVGSMFKTLMQRERTEKLITEIGLVFDIVDTVLKPAQNRVAYKSNVPTKGT